MEEQNKSRIQAKNAVLGLLSSATSSSNSYATAPVRNQLLFNGIAGVKLKKTTTVEKTMFAKTSASVPCVKPQTMESSDKRVPLSKLIDFPGDAEAISKHLQDEAKINPAGADSYGITALHKFASWNKTNFLDLLIPKLTKEELNAVCPDGKTALHWAVEMAAVAAVKTV